MHIYQKESNKQIWVNKKKTFLNLRYSIFDVWQLNLSSDMTIFMKKNKISQYELIKKDPVLNLKYSIFG